MPARPSLRRRLLLAFVLATLAPVALLSLLHARTYVKSVEGDRVDRLGEAAYAISLQLSGTIDEHRRGLLALARAFEVQRDLSPEKLLPALRETCGDGLPGCETQPRRCAAQRTACTLPLLAPRVRFSRRHSVPSVSSRRE